MSAMQDRQEEYRRSYGSGYGTGWKQGDPCRVDGKEIMLEKGVRLQSGRMYEARILALSRENGVQMAELRITASVKGFDGKPVRQEWTHPKMIPTSKLRKALLK